MTLNVIQTEASKFKSESIQTSIRGALFNLIELGVLHFLRVKGQAFIVDGGRNSSANAAEGARAAGYAECLQDLEYFLEKFVHIQPQEAQTLRPNYGADKRLIDSGDYTREELDEYKRTGQLRSPLQPRPAS